MKTKLLLTIIVLLAGSLFFSASAQDNINTLIEKCKKMDNIDVNVSKVKTSTDGKSTSFETTTISIKSNKSLTDEFLAAFKRDSEKADSTTENETNGEINLLMCTFGSNIYTYSSKKDGVTISVYRVN